MFQKRRSLTLGQTSGELGGPVHTPRVAGNESMVLGDGRNQVHIDLLEDPPKKFFVEGIIVIDGVGIRIMPVPLDLLLESLDGLEGFALGRFGLAGRIGIANRAGADFGFRETAHENSPPRKDVGSFEPST